MGRTPPTDVRRTLRQEVGFGCPHAGCRSPFLEYHHFDPPWCEGKGHDPGGMIALCGMHHKFADRGNYSKTELRALKTSPATAEEMRGEFPWSKSHFLVRLGGSYVDSPTEVLNLGGETVIEVTKNTDGLLLLSVSLRGEGGEQVLRIDENMIVSDPSDLHDAELSASQHRVKVWSSAPEVGLELAFNRVTMSGLTDLLRKDRERRDRRTKAIMKDALDSMPEEHRAFLEQALERGPETEGTEMKQGTLPDDVWQAHLENDPGVLVKSWAKKHLDDEGKIALLNFVRLVTYSNGRRLEVHDGVTLGNLQIDYGAMMGNRQGAIRL